MEVVLLERIERLGQMGDVVDVKPGYARNYLLPQKKALRATKVFCSLKGSANSSKRIICSGGMSAICGQPAG